MKHLINYYSKLMAVLCLAVLMSISNLLADNTPLCFTARNGTIAMYYFRKNKNFIEYSYNDTTWSDYRTYCIVLSPNQSVYFRLDSDYYSNHTLIGPYGDENYNDCSYFTFNRVYSNDTLSTIEASGDIMSLFKSGQSSVPDYAFRYLFHNCTLLTTAPEMSATTLGVRCYEGMFEGCTSLTTAPELPATILDTSCYYSMFEGCTSLTTTPSILPATSMERACYVRMFSGCTSLTVAPELPATTLERGCYSSMFEGCTSLTIPPLLPATTLAEQCYYEMFEGCTSLIALPPLLATTLPTNCYTWMFKNCDSLRVNSVGPGARWKIPTSSRYLLTTVFTGTGGTVTHIAYTNTTYYVASAPQYNITVSSNDTTLGTVNGAGTGIYYFGDIDTLIATPIPHYHFTRWSDGNTSNPRYLTVISDTSLTAIFEINRYNVSANYNYANGKVTGTGAYDYNTTATLTATPYEHCRFVGWSDGDTSNVKSFTVTGDTMLTLVFTRDKHTVTATCEHGTVAGCGEFEYGSTAMLVVHPHTGYKFKEWDDGNTDNPRTLVVNGDIELEAICEKNKTAVEDVEGDFDITLAPNPVKIGETIIINGSFSDEELNGMMVEVIDLNGMVVRRNKANSSPVEIEGADVAGTYIVRITAGTGKVYTQKLIVK